MCIVVDVNCLPAVLKEKHSLHAEFKPVLDWIREDKGKLVYGGSKYKEELKRLIYCLKTLASFERKGWTVHVSNQKVDDEQNEIDKAYSHSRFDDSHLVAIILVSRCRLLCSLDRKAHPFLTNNQFYVGKHPSLKKPKVYSSAKHIGLLTDKNIAPICKSC